MKGHFWSPLEWFDCQLDFTMALSCKMEFNHDLLWHSVYSKERNRKKGTLYAKWRHAQSQSQLATIFNYSSVDLCFWAKRLKLEIRPRWWWRKSLEKVRVCLQTRPEGRWKDKEEPRPQWRWTLWKTKVQTSFDLQADPQAPHSYLPTRTLCKSRAFYIQFFPPPLTIPKATVHKNASQMPWNLRNLKLNFLVLNLNCSLLLQISLLWELHLSQGSLQPTLQICIVRDSKMFI